MGGLFIPTLAAGFFPLIMCIVLLYKNTRVSEMAASFTRMGAPKSVIVPIAVAVRYIPALKEEWLHIRDAMRMRNVTNGIRNPLKRLVCKIECYLVPLFVASIQSADELSAAAVTRGIDNPVKPSCRNYRPMGLRDYIVIVIAVLIDDVPVTELPEYELAKQTASVFQNPKSQFFNTDAVCLNCQAGKSSGSLLLVHIFRTRRLSSWMSRRRTLTPVRFRKYG